MRIRKRRTRREKYIIVFNTQSTILVTIKAKEEKKKKQKDEKGMEKRKRKEKNHPTTLSPVPLLPSSFTHAHPPC